MYSRYCNALYRSYKISSQGILDKIYIMNNIKNPSYKDLEFLESLYETLRSAILDRRRFTVQCIPADKRDIQHEYFISILEKALNKVAILLEEINLMPEPSYNIKDVIIQYSPPEEESNISKIRKNRKSMMLNNIKIDEERDKIVSELLKEKYSKYVDIDNRSIVYEIDTENDITIMRQLSKIETEELIKIKQLYDQFPNLSDMAFPSIETIFGYLLYNKDYNIIKYMRNNRLLDKKIKILDVPFMYTFSNDITDTGYDCNRYKFCYKIYMDVNFNIKNPKNILYEGRYEEIINYENISKYIEINKQYIVLIDLKNDMVKTVLGEMLIKNNEISKYAYNEGKNMDEILLNSIIEIISTYYYYNEGLIVGSVGVVGTNMANKRYRWYEILFIYLYSRGDTDRIKNLKKIGILDPDRLSEEIYNNVTIGRIVEINKEAAFIGLMEESLEKKIEVFKKIYSKKYEDAIIGYLKDLK